MLEHASLVRGQLLSGLGAEANPEDARASLLDLDDVPGGEVDQCGRDGLVRHAEVVDEEVRDRRRLRPEVERRGPDRRLGGMPGGVQDGGACEPERAGREGEQREIRVSSDQIRDVHARIVSHAVDEGAAARLTPP